MKTLASLFFFSFLISSISYSQDMSHNADGSGEVILDNDKMEVVKYVGEPQGNVCGLGEHHHDAHLTVALSDASVLITSPDGKQQTAEIPAGAAIWFDAGTHSAMNSGKADTEFLLIYLKE